MPDDLYTWNLEEENNKLKAQNLQLAAEVERLKGAGPNAPPSPFLERRLADRLRSMPVLEADVRKKIREQDKALQEAKKMLEKAVAALDEKNIEIKRLQARVRQLSLQCSIKTVEADTNDRIAKVIRELREKGIEVLEATPQVELLDTLLELAEL